MPYRLVRVAKGAGYYVENIITKKRFSKKPLPKLRAINQKNLLEKIEERKNK